MNIRRIIYLAILLASFFFTSACSAFQKKNNIDIVVDKKTNYELYISSNASESLKEQVKKFQQYVTQVSGVTIPIVNEEGKNQIVIGDSMYIASIDNSFPFDKIKKDGFAIQLKDQYVLVYGEKLGTIYGVYELLKLIGCRNYGRNNTYIPKKTTIILSDTTILENPIFQTRFLHSYEAMSEEYCYWHRLDIPPVKNNEWLKYKHWIHTTTRFISPGEYFKKHPEYFMSHNGKRVPKEIDFSNKQVFNIIKTKIDKKLEENPKIKYIGISQADKNKEWVGNNYECNEIKKIGGSKSSVIIDFVNKFAALYPDKIITTLAYQYSEAPPSTQKIKPRDNVLIILTNTSTNRVVATSPSLNKKFTKNLKGWQKLTKNIMVWDYGANMSYPLMPFPNFHLLQKGIKSLNNLGVNKIFEQMNGKRGADFQELRSFLVAKLLWNPNINIDSTINEFLGEYYGLAAPFMKQYIKEMTGALKKGGISLSRTRGVTHFDRSYLSLEMLEKYDGLFKKAKGAVGDNQKVYIRIDKAQQALRYAKIELYRNKVYREKGSSKKNSLRRIKYMTNDEYNNLLEEFIKKAEKYKTEEAVSKMPIKKYLDKVPGNKKK